MGEPFFKLVHLGKQIQIKSAGFIIDLGINDKMSSQDGKSDEVLVGGGYQNSDSEPVSYGFMLAKDDLFSRSFVIESLPKDSDVDCFSTDPADLKPVECTGKLHLRRPNKDD